MTIDFDSSQEPRSLAQQLALIRSVRDGLITDETDWLEWKCEPALTSVAVAKTAKAILAFANRDPRAARHYVGGVGLFLLGVQPGDAPGLEGPKLDPVDLHNKIVPLCGTTVQWRADYLTLDEATILLVTVAPPQPGAPPYPARKSVGEPGNSGRLILTDGAIYVRRGTASAPARAEQIDMLLARYAAGQSHGPGQLEVKVGCVNEPRAALDTTSTALDHAASKAVSQLPPPRRRKPEPSRPSRTNSDLAKRLGPESSVAENVLEQIRASIRASDSVVFGSNGPVDEAAEAHYADKLAKHKDSVREALPEHLQAAAIAQRLAPLTLTLTNPTEGTIAGIAITLELDLPSETGTVEFDPEDSEPEIPPLPKPPLPPSAEHLRGLGRALGRGDFGFAPHLRLNGMAKLSLPTVSRTGDQVTVKFRDEELRALEVDHRLPTLMLVVQDPTVRSIPARWSATSAHLHGKIGGALTIALDDDPVAAADLVEPIDPISTY